MCNIHIGFPSSSDNKESACSVEDPSSVPGWGRSPGKGNGYLIKNCGSGLLCFCLFVLFLFLNIFEAVVEL